MQGEHSHSTTRILRIWRPSWRRSSSGLGGRRPAPALSGDGEKDLPATAAVGYNLLVVGHLQFSAPPAAVAPAAWVAFIDYNMSV